jgi:porphobilinogen synthase
MSHKEIKPCNFVKFVYFSKFLRLKVVIMIQYPHVRMRRRRYQANVRALLCETQLLPQQLILPLFIKHGKDIKQPIASMPGHHQWSLDRLPEEIRQLQQLDIKSVMLFGIPAMKDASGSASLLKDGLIQQAIKIIKDIAPEMLVISDVCLCEYTSHGHCGVLDARQEVDNDATLELLAAQAISLAQAGSDVIAPSANMDGMVQAIRQGLDQASLQNIPILSYAVKYASAFYGPFRHAAEGAPQFGDRKTYQMDIGNGKEALLEAELDVQEGADFLLIKPAHTYLDVLHQVKQHLPGVPVGAYHVSGEYAMIKAAAEKGWLDEKACMLEALIAIKRAGADFIVTYAAKEVLGW